MRAHKCFNWKFNRFACTLKRNANRFHSTHFTLVQVHEQETWMRPIDLWLRSMRALVKTVTTKPNPDFVIYRRILIRFPLTSFLLRSHSIACLAVHKKQFVKVTTHCVPAQKLKWWKKLVDLLELHQNACSTHHSMPLRYTCAPVHEDQISVASATVSFLLIPFINNNFFDFFTVCHTLICLSF